MRKIGQASAQERRVAFMAGAFQGAPRPGISRVFSSSQDQPGGTPEASQLPACDRYRKDDSVLRLMMPLLRCILGSLQERVSRPLQQLRYVRGRANVQDCHAEEPLPGIAILPNGGIVDVNKRQGLPVVNPHGMGALGERHSKYFGGWRDSLFRFSGLYHSSSLVLIYRDSLERKECRGLGDLSRFGTV